MYQINYGETIFTVGGVDIGLRINNTIHYLGQLWKYKRQRSIIIQDFEICFNYEKN